MAEYGFYRDSGAAWQRALPPEVQRIGGEAALRRCWELLVLDREGARRLSGQGRGPLCGCVGRAAAGAAGGILRAVAPEQPDAVQSGAAVRAVRSAAADGAGRYGHRAAGHPAADGVGLLGDGAAAASGGDAPAAGAAMR